MAVADHPSPAELKSFAVGGLPEARRRELEDHIAACAACVRDLESAGDDSLVRLARRANSTLTPSVAAVLEKLEYEVATEPTLVLLDLLPELRDHPRYRVTKRLGAGGMGVVYRAHHRIMDRIVALKVMNPAIIASPDAVERFQREVRAAAKLSHPNIVTAFDADQAGGLHFLVMELLDGVSLDRWVAKKGPQPEGLASYFIRQAAMGLQHAHQMGMVHRDIKPQNLFLTRRGQVKILDFGLARLAYGAEEEAADTAKGSTDVADTSPGSPIAAHRLERMTQTSALLGTPDFVAPEQTRDARKVDIRADLYSLGCTFYFLLTGRVPFPSGSLQQRLLSHCLEDPTPMEELRPGLAKPIAAIVRKLMAKQPEDRFATPAELAAALLPFAKAQPESLQLGATPLPAGARIAAETPVAAVKANTIREPKSRRRSENGDELRKPAKRKNRAQERVPRWLLVGLPLILALLVLGEGGKLLLDRFSGPPTPSGFAARGDAKVPSGPTPPPREETPPGRTESGEASQQPPPRPDSTQRQAEVQADVLFLLPTSGLWLPDYRPVRDRLEAAGLRCRVATRGGLPSQPLKDGGAIAADCPLDEKLSMADFRALVFVGADTAEFTNWPASARHAQRLLKEARRNGAVIAAICRGQTVLLKHGWLDDKRVARNVQLTQENIYRQAPRVKLVEGQPVVVDGKLITAASPDDAEPFAAAIVAGLK